MGELGGWLDPAELPVPEVRLHRHRLPRGGAERPEGRERAGGLTLLGEAPAQYSRSGLCGYRGVHPHPLRPVHPVRDLRHPLAQPLDEHPALHLPDPDLLGPDLRRSPGGLASPQPHVRRPLRLPYHPLRLLPRPRLGAGRRFRPRPEGRIEGGHWCASAKPALGDDNDSWRDAPRDDNPRSLPDVRRRAVWGPLG